MPAFGNEIESSRLLLARSAPCLVMYSGVRINDDDRKTQRIQKILALEYFVFSLSAFFEQVFHNITTQYHGGRMKQRR